MKIHLKELNWCQMDGGLLMMAWKLRFDYLSQGNNMKNTGDLLDLENSISNDSSEFEKPLSMSEFETKLKEKGTSYHIYHPFHVMMAEGN